MNAEIPILLEFWASWCLPCKMMEPMLEDLSVKHVNKLKILKINADLNPRIVSEYNITGLPTLILFIDGNEQNRHIGSLSSSQIETILEGII